MGIEGWVVGIEGWVVGTEGGEREFQLWGLVTEV